MKENQVELNEEALSDLLKKAVNRIGHAREYYIHMEGESGGLVPSKLLVTSKLTTWYRSFARSGHMVQNHAC